METVFINISKKFDFDDVEFLKKNKIYIDINDFINQEDENISVDINGLILITLRVFNEIIKIIQTSNYQIIFHENKIFSRQLKHLKTIELSNLIELISDLYKIKLITMYDDIVDIKRDFIHDLKNKTIDCLEKYINYYLESDNYLDEIFKIEEELFAKVTINKQLTFLDCTNKYKINTKIENNFKICGIKTKNIKHILFSFKESFMDNVNLKFSIKQDKTNDTIEYISFITFLFLPIQAISGIFGMNVKVPFEDEKSLVYFFSLVGITPLIWILYSIYKQFIKIKKF